MITEHYDLLAKLFDYPSLNYKDKVIKVQNMVDNFYPNFSEILIDFVEFSQKASLKEMEEVYTRTFDVQAITTLDIGYVLFGDDYKRGELLVNLNRELRQAEIDPENELADNIKNLLKLLPRMKDEFLKKELAVRIVIPGIYKIICEFEGKNIEIKENLYKKHHNVVIDKSAVYGRIYQNTLLLVLNILEIDFGEYDSKKDIISNNFTRSVKAEFEVN